MEREDTSGELKVNDANTDKTKDTKRMETMKIISESGWKGMKRTNLTETNQEKLTKKTTIMKTGKT